ncbi:MAG: DUF4388 domain-containing protein [Gemmatimonadetes bacterium]|nr:MAG: DUF4388 domain-containing protein [Gemmatimonadota bacterium]
MNTEGMLQETPLQEILQTISLNRSSGKLYLKSDVGHGQIMFRQGKIVGAQSSLESLRLGDILILQGWLNTPQLEEALTLQKETDEHHLIGEILQQHNWVTADNIEYALKLQVQYVFFNLLRWNVGTYTFYEGAVPDTTPVKFLVEELLMEGMRRLEDDDDNDIEVITVNELEIVDAESPAEEVTPPENLNTPTPPTYEDIVISDPQPTPTETAPSNTLSGIAAKHRLHFLEMLQQRLGNRYLEEIQSIEVKDDQSIRDILDIFRKDPRVKIAALVAKDGLFYGTSTNARENVYAVGAMASNTWGMILSFGEELLNHKQLTSVYFHFEEDVVLLQLISDNIALLIVGELGIDLEFISCTLLAYQDHLLNLLETQHI